MSGDQVRDNWHIASRLAVAGLVGGAVWFVPGGDYDNTGFFVRLVASALCVGAISASWWGLAVAPAAFWLAIGAHRATDCPDCGGGGEELPGEALFVIYTLISSTVVMVAAAGVLLSKLALRVWTPPVTVPLWAAAGLPVLLAAGAILGLVARDQDRADDNGPVVHDTGDVRFRAGAEWDGDSDQGISEAELRRFSEHPLVWLGTSFGGYNLQHAIAEGTARPTSGLPVDGVMMFIYGHCGPAPCPAPLHVHVSAICRGPTFSQGDIAERLPSGAAVQRPAPGNFEEGRKVTIYTASIMASATWTTPDLTVDQVLASLTSPNGATLGPPDPPPCA